MHIVTVTNDAYAPYLSVMLHSLMANKVSAKPVSIYVMHNGISSENKRKLSNAMKKLNTPISFISVDETKLNDVDDKLLKTRFGKETFYRIFIPDYLDKHIEKALYLDSDMIVRHDIGKLWKMDLKEHSLAAVMDPPSREEKCRRLGIESARYFNAGVLLLNLNKWRENDISGKVMDFVRQNPEKIVLPDQDALNAVLHDAWLELDPKWNRRPLEFNRGMKTSILHFMGPLKPWKNRPYGKKEYLKYAELTKW